MKDNPLLILLIVFVLVGFLAGSVKNSRERDKTDLTSSIVIRGSKGPVGNNVKEISKEIAKTEKEIENVEKKIEEIAEKEKRSIYYGKITASNISGLNNPDPSREYITLNVSSGNENPINITGWVLRSDVTGYGMIIGKGSYLPRMDVQGFETIKLNPGDRAYLIKGFSPIRTSFRLNICTGFFAENRRFTPYLPKQCPNPRDEVLPQFYGNDYDQNYRFDQEDKCAKYIERLNRCQTPPRTFDDDFPLACRDYIQENFTYDACVSKNISSTDFYKNEWRIYLNKFGTIWRPRADKIRLLDEFGKTVDIIEYKR